MGKSFSTGIVVDFTGGRLTSDAVGLVLREFWEYLRENSFQNFSLNSLDEVADILSDGLSFLAQQPEIVRSMTNYNWLNTLCLTCN